MKKIKKCITKDKIELTQWKCLFQLSDLCENQVFWAAAVQAQDEAYWLEELLDARPELLLLHPTGGSRVQDTRLDDELEQIFQSLTGFLAGRRKGHAVSWGTGHTVLSVP